jgi:hypothetical protein
MALSNGLVAPGRDSFWPSGPRGYVAGNINRVHAKNAARFFRLRHPSAVYVRQDKVPEARNFRFISRELE